MLFIKGTPHDLYLSKRLNSLLDSVKTRHTTPQKVPLVTPSIEWAWRGVTWKDQSTQQHRTLNKAFSGTQSISAKDTISVLVWWSRLQFFLAGLWTIV